MDDAEGLLDATLNLHVGGDQTVGDLIDHEAIEGVEG